MSKPIDKWGMKWESLLTQEEYINKLAYIGNEMSKPIDM